MKLLGLGDNVFDAYLFRDELYPGGNAANVSVLARRIGAEYTGYLGVLADDPPGRHFLAALREESVEVSRVRIGVGKSACNYIVSHDLKSTGVIAHSQEIMAKRPCKIFSLYT